MVLVLLYIIWGVSIFFYKKNRNEKKISFECGFLPFSFSRIPFSLRFFFILIIFVMFDVEISLFLQFPFQLKKNFLKVRFLFLIFFFVLTICLFEEWRRGGLFWVKINNFFFIFFSWLVLILIKLINIPIFTLLERKVLSYIQNRKGPKKVSFLGIFQPISDGLKLILKKLILPKKKNYLIFFFRPIFLFFLMLINFFLVSTFKKKIFIIKFSLLLFLCLSSLQIFFLLSSRWSRKSKYALLGCVRNCIQTISYEICFLTIIFFPCSTLSKNFCIILKKKNMKIFFFFILLPIFFLWLILCVIETKRAPFDFAEGERELVSGFKIEFSSFSFALIFLAEYGKIIIISLLSANLFLSKKRALKVLSFNLIIFLIIVFRGSFPRFRIDLLRNYCWVVILPLLLLLFFLIFIF